jgi:hypothetical protein
LLRDEKFRQGDLHTGFIEEFFARESPDAKSDPNLEIVAAIAAVLSEEKPAATTPVAGAAPWLTEGRRRMMR